MRQLKKHIREINLLEDCLQDTSPFLAVQLLQRLVIGLLDSRSAVGCICGRLVQYFLKETRENAIVS